MSQACDLRAVSVSWIRRCSFHFVNLRDGDTALHERTAALSVIQGSCKNELYTVNNVHVTVLMIK